MCRDWTARLRHVRNAVALQRFKQLMRLKELLSLRCPHTWPLHLVLLWQLPRVTKVMRGLPHARNSSKNSRPPQLSLNSNRAAPGSYPPILPPCGAILLWGTAMLMVLRRCVTDELAAGMGRRLVA